MSAAATCAPPRHHSQSVIGARESPPGPGCPGSRSCRRSRGSTLSARSSWSRARYSAVSSSRRAVHSSQTATGRTPTAWAAKTAAASSCRRFTAKNTAGRCRPDEVTMSARQIRRHSRYSAAASRSPVSKPIAASWPQLSIVSSGSSPKASTQGTRATTASTSRTDCRMTAARSACSPCDPGSTCRRKYRAGTEYPAACGAKVSGNTVARRITDGSRGGGGAGGASASRTSGRSRTACKTD